MKNASVSSAKKKKGRPAKVHKKKIFVSTFTPPHETLVYDTYWKFAAERQEIFFRRMENPAAGIWTDDPILMRHKFTNAYRASDRVSQYLIRNVIGSDDRGVTDTFFRILLFKLFNKIETWDLLEQSLGDISWGSFNFSAYDKVLSEEMARKRTIYSAAYIMPSGKSRFGFERKHQNHLELLKWFMDNRFPERIAQAPSLKYVFETMSTAPGLGNFLAFQYTIDLNYSSIISYSENDFVVAGPGALNGMAKCFSNADQYAPDDLIRYVTEKQHEEFEKRELTFRDLWGRALHLIDCQNLFCEADKYARVKHPEFCGASGRTRIKQIFKPSPYERIRYMYPSKWGLNDKVVQAESHGRLI
ncbi:MAG: putative DNA base hypermodification protein [Rhodospirillales bacterium]|nr:putative DNA base hypermodification protein [Rhodospirillales bacterium]